MLLKMVLPKKLLLKKLAEKVNTTDTSEFILKAKYQRNKAEVEKKIPDVIDFVKKAKLTELGNKILDISNLATKLKNCVNYSWK